MALIVEDGTGRTDAESYASVATLLAYFTSARGASSAYSALLGASTATHEALLRWATRSADTLWDYDGEPLTTTQALRFPRTGVYDLDGRERPSGVLPLPLVHGVCEISLALFTDAARLDDQETGLSALAVGPIKLAFERLDRPAALPRAALQLLSQVGSSRDPGARSVFWLERA